MHLSSLTLVAAVLQLASAQTPKGFTPEVSQNLIVAFGNNTISPPGELILRSG
jgi:hypothetical protein